MQCLSVVVCSLLLTTCRKHLKTSWVAFWRRRLSSNSRLPPESLSQLIVQAVHSKDSKLLEVGEVIWAM